MALPILVKHPHRTPTLREELTDAALEPCTLDTQPVIDQAQVVMKGLGRASRLFAAYWPRDTFGVLANTSRRLGAFLCPSTSMK